MRANEITLVVEADPNKSKGFVFKLDNEVALKGIIARSVDYEKLKKANIWRVVSIEDISAWNKNHDISVTELLHGKIIEQIDVCD